MFKKSDSEIKENFKKLKTRRELTELLEVSDDKLVYILYAIPDKEKYFNFDISKKSGGKRTISSPIEDLKYLQEKLSYVLNLIYEPPSCVHGFIEDKSIATNADPHVGKKYVFNIDIKEFFPSINFGRVRGLFLNKPFNISEKVATILAQIACNENSIPQGAPSSPVISNMICKKLDYQLVDLAKNNGCFYTRYVDDLTFSSSRREFPEDIAKLEKSNWVVGEELKNILESNGFKVNHEKVRLQEKRHRQEVTGLVVNRIRNVPREYIRKIRAILHAVRKFGEENAEKEFYQKYDDKNRNPKKKLPSIDRVLHGMLRYVKMVKGRESAVFVNYWNRFVDLFPKYGEKILPDSAKIDVFVEGITDRDVFKQATELFNPQLLNKIKFKSSADAGSNWVKDQLISRKTSRKKKLAIGIFDNDEAGKKSKKELHSFLGDNGYKYIEVLKLKAPKHLRRIFQKDMHLPVGLEEFYSEEVWRYADEKDFLDKRSEIVQLNDFEHIDKSFVKHCEEKGFSEKEIMYLTKCFSKAENKRKIVKFILEKSQEKKRKYLSSLESTIDRLADIVDENKN